MLRKALVILVASSATAALAEAPDPGTVSIRSLQYRGTGCPSGSVAANISPDNKAMTVLFDDFVVAAEGRRRADSKNCRVDVELNVPQGWSYGLFCVEFRGFADLPAGARGTQSARYSLNRRTLEVGRMSKIGPFSDDYQHLNQVPLSSTPFSSCDGQETLGIDTTIQVVSRRSGEGALMTVDSLDGELKHHYGIAWRRCGNGGGGNGSSETIAVSDISRNRTLGVGADGATYDVQNFGGACYKAVRNGTPITDCEHGFKFYLGNRFIAATRGAAGKVYRLDGSLATPANSTFHRLECAQSTNTSYQCTASVGARRSSLTLSTR